MALPAFDLVQFNNTLSWTCPFHTLESFNYYQFIVYFCNLFGFDEYHFP